jgi:hypothetical protein
MRNDNLACLLDQRRWQSGGEVSPRPAIELCEKRVPRFKCSGTTVANKYGLLAHYTTEGGLQKIRELDSIGGKEGYGCWLTPTPYAACIAPYDLGLKTPCNVCLLVDVSKCEELWGPGTSGKSVLYSAIWRGGAIEFYSAVPVPYDYVTREIQLAPCGDLHR